MAKYGPGRMLRQSFFTSADLIDLPHWVQILFAGLWEWADDSGMIRHNMAFFQGTLLCCTKTPGTRGGPGARQVEDQKEDLKRLGHLSGTGRHTPSEASIEAALRVLTDRGCLRREDKADGVTYLRILNFNKHQDVGTADALRAGAHNQSSNTNKQGSRSTRERLLAREEREAEEDESRSRAYRANTRSVIADLAKVAADAVPPPAEFINIGAELRKAAEARKEREALEAQKATP